MQIIKLVLARKVGALGLILKMMVFGLGSDLFRRFVILYKVGNHFVQFFSKKGGVSIELQTKMTF